MVLLSPISGLFLLFVSVLAPSKETRVDLLESCNVVSFPFGVNAAMFSQAQLAFPQSAEEIYMNDFVDLDDLRRSCPAGTNLVGPIDPDGLRRVVNGQSAAACIKSNGVSHGPSITWYEDGSKAQAGEYYDNLKEGMWSFWYENGQLSGRGNFSKGKAEGVWVTWHDNQQKESEGLYVDGKHHGQFTNWDRKGYVTKVLKYKHGKLLDE